MKKEKLPKFARRIRKLRGKMLMTQTDLARALETTPATVSRWERALSAPNDVNRYKLARVFGVSPDRFNRTRK